MAPGHFRDHDAPGHSFGDNRNLDLGWPLAPPFRASQNFDTTWPHGGSDVTIVVIIVVTIARHARPSPTRLRTDKVSSAHL